MQGQRTNWADYLGAVRAVETLGYGSIWTFDHLLPFAGPDDRPCFETLTTLAAMAVLTSRIRIGVLLSELWNACALPWKLAAIEPGM